MPSHIGKYSIISVLRKPRVGIVYKAFDATVRRHVALKAIRLDVFEDEEPEDRFASRFWNEVRAVGDLRHPGIVAVYDVGRDDTYAFMAMEMVEGRTLDEHFAARTRFDAMQVVRFVISLLDALAHIHHHDVWHRDLRPENLVVTEGGQAKIIDFFLAHLESSTLTAVGQIVGSQGYLAPEQYVGGAVDHRADIFSVGVLLYRMLVGEQPFTGTAAVIMQKTCQETPGLPSQRAAGRVSAAFDPVVMRALAKNPAARFQSATAFREALYEAAHPHAAAPAAAAAVQSPAPPASAHGFDPRFVAELQTRLVSYIGPRASEAVMRVLKPGMTQAGAVAYLAAEITDEKERLQFLGEMRAQL